MGILILNSEKNRQANWFILRTKRSAGAALVKNVFELCHKIVILHPLHFGVP
jgi:hypothetical protein